MDDQPAFIVEPGSRTSGGQNPCEVRLLRVTLCLRGDELSQY
jgi:hypothetical protein